MLLMYKNELVHVRAFYMFTYYNKASGHRCEQMGLR